MRVSWFVGATLFQTLMAGEYLLSTSSYVSKSGNACQQIRLIGLCGWMDGFQTDTSPGGNGV